MGVIDGEVAMETAKTEFEERMIDLGKMCRFGADTSGMGVRCHLGVLCEFPSRNTTAGFLESSDVV